MLLVDDLAAGGTKNLRHTPRGLVTLLIVLNRRTDKQAQSNMPPQLFQSRGIKTCDPSISSPTRYKSDTPLILLWTRLTTLLNITDGLHTINMHTDMELITPIKFR